MFDKPNFSDLVVSARSCSYSKERAIVSNYITSTSRTPTFAEVAVYIDLSLLHIFRQIPPGFRSKTLLRNYSIWHKQWFTLLRAWRRYDFPSNSFPSKLSTTPWHDNRSSSCSCRTCIHLQHRLKIISVGRQPASLHSFSSHVEEERHRRFQQLQWEAGISPTALVFRTDTAVHSMQGCWNYFPPAKQYIFYLN